MKIWKWLNLQLFAEGAGEGGEGDGAGAETGENAVDAEQQRLLELNVPKDKVERWAKRKAARDKRNGVVNPPKAEKPAATAQTQTTEQDVQKEETKEQEEAPAKPTWDEIMKDPDYNKAMQEVIRGRLKPAKQAEAFAKAVAPLLAKQFGMDAENVDLAALAKSMTDKAAESREEQAAESMGVSPETYRAIRQNQQKEQETIQDKRLREHAERVCREAEALRQEIPGFDLMAERANNEVFRRMVDNPDNPIPLKTAYLAVHHNELVQTAVTKAIEESTLKAANAVKAGTRRPEEAGTGKQASSLTTFDYAKATKAEREALKARIREAAARGEKIYPGM